MGWFKRIFGGTGGPASKHTKKDAGRSYTLADGEPPLSRGMEVAAERAGALALTVNRSMRSASSEISATSKQWHLKTAREALAEILRIATKYPAIKPVGLDAVTKDLDRLESDTGEDPPSSAFRVINDSVEIAAISKNADTYASRLDVAEKVLFTAKQTAESFGRRINGIDDAEAAIEALKRRGPPISAVRTKRPSTRANPPPRDIMRPEQLRPPELDISPWMPVAPENTGIRSAESWATLRDDLRSGRFWADRAKHARDDPAQRLLIGLEDLPLPGAFKQCAIATRALVRAAKKSGDSLERPLSLLYWLAAMESFTIPYSQRLGAPGHNAMEMASGAEVAALPFAYDSLGYEHLDLLTVP